MTTQQQMYNSLDLPQLQQLLSELYGEKEIVHQTERYRNLISGFIKQFGEADVQLFSAPGRTEIGGNHTDHNHGKVLAGSINYDTIAASCKVDEPAITIVSEGYDGEFSIQLDDLSLQSDENGTLKLIKGVVAGFRAHGYNVGGFNAYVTTNVLSASGLSSSASFEMLICSILSTYYNDETLDAVMMSKIGKYAENHFWSKPSGLLDQMACAYGGLVKIDFANPEEPVIEPVHYNFYEHGYSLIIVNTGGNHADLTEDYASIPNEMHTVSNILGASVCRDISMTDLYENLAKLRQDAGDRAILRTMHFLKENQRVDDQVTALQEGDLITFLNLLTDSGNSSWKWLQNCYRASEHVDQSMAIALSVTEIFLKKIGRGACRLHGGGFAGVILTVIPNEEVEAYTELIHNTLKTSVFPIHIRAYGAICVSSLIK